MPVSVAVPTVNQSSCHRPTNKSRTVKTEKKLIVPKSRLVGSFVFFIWKRRKQFSETLSLPSAKCSQKNLGQLRKKIKINKPKNWLQCLPNSRDLKLIRCWVFDDSPTQLRGILVQLKMAIDSYFCPPISSFCELTCSKRSSNLWNNLSCLFHCNFALTKLEIAAENLKSQKTY